MWQKKFQKNSFLPEILQIFFRKREYCDKMLPFFPVCLISHTKKVAGSNQSSRVMKNV
jgi:hypothetical protein